MFKAIVKAVRGRSGEEAEFRAERPDPRIRQYDILEFVRWVQQERSSN